MKWMRQRHLTSWLLALAYLGGVAGTLWDWREHYVGVSNQAPHALIDLSGLLVLAVLGFAGWRRYSLATRTTIYYLLVLVAVIVFAPFVLMVTAPHSALMAAFMRFAMTRGALSLQGPFVVLAAWMAWRWLGLAHVTAARIAAATGVVIVAAASIWDVYWHQSHPLEMGASMNMMTLPPHQLILAGFTVGLVGAVALLISRLPAAVRQLS